MIGVAVLQKLQLGGPPTVLMQASLRYSNKCPLNEIPNDKETYRSFKYTPASAGFDKADCWAIASTYM